MVRLVAAGLAVAVGLAAKAPAGELPFDLVLRIMASPFTRIASDGEVPVLGVHLVLVNGLVAFEDGRPTAARAGWVLRGPASRAPSGVPQ